MPLLASHPGYKVAQPRGLIRVIFLASNEGAKRDMGSYTGSGRTKRKKKKRRRSKSRKSQAGLISDQKRVKNSAMKSSFETTAEVLKVDDELGLVFGWGIISKVDDEPYFDTQGDHIPEDAMLKATSEFMFDVRTAGDMHARNDDGSAVGKGTIVHSMPLTKELAEAFGLVTTKTGWLIGMKPETDMLEKFRDGTYTGFSIGGFRGDDEVLEDDE